MKKALKETNYEILGCRKTTKKEFMCPYFEEETTFLKTTLFCRWYHKYISEKESLTRPEFCHCIKDTVTEEFCEAHPNCGDYCS